MKTELSPLVKETLKLRQSLTNSSYNVTDLMKIYQILNLSHNFVRDNIHQTDFGGKIENFDKDNIFIRSQKVLYRK